MIPLELEAELRRETVPQEMISSIQIKGFRGFSDFEMRGLGRVNLLVGTNNSGKTSVLEAIDLLTSRGEPISYLESIVAARRDIDNNYVLPRRCSLAPGTTTGRSRCIPSLYGTRGASRI